MFGHARKYLTALIEIDFDTVADWARAHDVAYTGFTSLAQHPAVERAAPAARSTAPTRELARVEQVKALPHPAQGARSGGGRRAGHADAQGEAHS